MSDWNQDFQILKDRLVIEEELPDEWDASESEEEEVSLRALKRKEKKETVPEPEADIESVLLSQLELKKLQEEEQLKSDMQNALDMFGARIEPVKEKINFKSINKTKEEKTEKVNEKTDVPSLKKLQEPALQKNVQKPKKKSLNIGGSLKANDMLDYDYDYGEDD